MKAQKRLRFRRYVGLALTLVVLALWNYVFVKLFDRAYGNFNSLDVAYLTGWILLFAFGFGASLWYLDTRGEIAKMFGQGEDFWRIHVKKKGFELEVAGNSSQEVEALFEKHNRKDSNEAK